MHGGLMKSIYTYLSGLYQRHWGDQQTRDHPNVSEVTMKYMGKISRYQMTYWPLGDIALVLIVCHSNVS